MDIIGQLAGLLTSILWSGSSVLFTKATQKVGVFVVNRVRVLLALAFLVLLNWVFYGYLLPIGAGWERWMWFALSGAVGYALGDMFLFDSFARIGPQRAMLMMSLAPLMSAGLAWIFFGEKLGGMQILGVILTLVGIAWVILRQRRTDKHLRGSPLRGVLTGVGAATGQAVGYILSKQGLTDGFSPLAGNSIRMLAAVVVLWVLAGIQGKVRDTIKSMQMNPPVLGWLTMAALIGPAVGATLSLFALQYTQVGVASTLIALPPIFLLPVSWLVFKEKFDLWAVVGTFIAIGGVALLFLT